MIKFLFGAICSAVVCYLVVNHPEWVESGVAKAREHLAVAAGNISRATAGTNSGGDSLRNSFASSSSSSTTTEINMGRVKSLVADMKSLSHEELWAVMDDADFDRRAAAGRILLRRADIPANDQGVTVVQQRYLRSSDPDALKTGFSYLGLLAQQGVPDQSIVPLAQQFTERSPRHQACDYSLWALGEVGSEELIPYFFHVAEDAKKYGPAARERAFCCLSQCGRYTPARRLEMIPEFIRVYDESHDAQTRHWCLQALAYCAPGVRSRSIDEWKQWWSRQ
jgi:hypothetical protein